MTDENQNPVNVTPLTEEDTGLGSGQEVNAEPAKFEPTPEEHVEGEPYKDETPSKPLEAGVQTVTPEGESEFVSAHPNADEDPEKHIGAETADPWNNPQENDWERGFRENAKSPNDDPRTGE